ncbi:hypothetical protein OBBRIDRAFT_837088 [Obba rivulosa]|uniref:Alpha-type protein kinase domain-containing protein n=1 Tax=Obba rivulosa TaxID=1052685 RepID=A0A8E2AN93_9APHY|nr:hypothetical protein OBBRIDRAFT_837088 [Obba rivulosa]
MALSAQSIIQEKKNKKMHYQNGGVKISATVWETPQDDEESLPGKMQQVSTLVYTQTFEPQTRARDALDILLEQAQRDYKKAYPLHNLLDWTTTSLYTHAGSGIFGCAKLDMDDVGDKTAQQLLDLMRARGACSKSALSNNTLELRFQYLSIHVRPHPTQGLESSGSGSGKRKASTSEPLRPPPPLRRIFQSAFIPPKTFTRAPPMTKVTFTRTAVSRSADGRVAFKSSDVVEHIKVAIDWKTGEDREREGKPFDRTGYIGQGRTKIAIYARINGEEYAVAQCKPDSGSEDETRSYLCQEIELLAHGHAFKKDFDGYAKTCDILNRIPKFYFNYEGAILGRFCSEDANAGLPYCHFIATLLLPCRMVDGGLVKMMGNDIFGNPTNNLEKAVHAFVHFAWIASKGHMMFCDLQGLYDRDRILCLIDPQCHTNNTSKDKIYWDGGPDAINSLLKEHAGVCTDNWICQQLGLEELQLEAPTTPRKGPRSMKALLN